MKKTQAHDRKVPQWTLRDLVHHPEQDFVTQSHELEKEISRLERCRLRLRPTMPSHDFRKAYELQETISSLMATLRASGFLWFAQNTKNQAARSFEARVRDQLSQFSNRMLFLDLWWQSLDDRNMRRLLNTSGDLRYYLESLWRLKPHTLSESEERVIAIKNSTGRDALGSLYGLVTNNFTFRMKLRNHTKILTREEVSSYVRNPSPQYRESAYQELLRVYGTNQDMIGETYKTLVLDWKNEGVHLRHYSNPIAVRNQSNDIPNEAVETLLNVCRKHAKLFQHFFRLKARLLGINTMTRYHLYAPIRTSSIRHSFEKALNIVMEAYTQFSPTLAKLARRVPAERHLDAQIRPGKMGGAFCYSVLPTLTPYVHMNYTGHTRDIATLAHELGHAVHSMMAKDHSVLTFHPSLPLAETASVFGEQLLAEAILAHEPRKQVRQALLVAQLDDLYATIVRQAYFVEFERLAHQLIAEGATVEKLGQCYLHLLRQQFGRAVKVSEDFRWEWLMIPHIFVSPFYCYAYSFGNLLVLALYQKYQREGSSFVPRYLDLLARGGSASPESILKPIGVDIRSEALWQSGFDRIQHMVEALEDTMP